MTILITICARGGSKGIPGKNIKDIAGLPLIVYSIKTAQKFSEYFNCHISLSTDSGQIKEVAAKYGLTTNYTRPDELSSDTAGKVDVLHHLLNYEETNRNVKYDYLLDLDVTSPLRNVEDLKNAFQIISSDLNAINLFSVNYAYKSPYFNMVELQKNGYYNLIKKLDSPINTRQSAPKVYDLNASFYFYKRVFFEKQFKSVMTEKSLIYIMPHICFDIDEKIDFEFLNYLITNNKLDFEL